MITNIHLYIFVFQIESINFVVSKRKSERRKKSCFKRSVNFVHATYTLYTRLVTVFKSWTKKSRKKIDGITHRVHRKYQSVKSKCAIDGFECLPTFLGYVNAQLQHTS